jgi:LysR family transcriptional regulator, regulator for bpeEF and oprC
MSLDIGDIDDLRAFVAIVDSNGVTAAAHILRMPKSTISRKLAALESRMGFRLLERSSRSVRVTEAGTSVYHYAQRIIDEVALLSEALKPGEVQGLLRVTCSFSMATLLLRPLLGFVDKGYPEFD